MHRVLRLAPLAFLVVGCSHQAPAPAAPARQPNPPVVLTNHLGYDLAGAKHAVVRAAQGDVVSACEVRTVAADATAQPATVRAVGRVDHWRDWFFWTVDFDSLDREGTYTIACDSNRGPIRSSPFAVQADLLERNTLSDVLYYLKSQRSSGPLDRADRHLPFEGAKQGTLDAHGGWWDATGDYGKHLSHLSFSTYFNPQQIPLVVYSLLKSRELLAREEWPPVARYLDRILDEAAFGADYLVRVKAPSGSFYRSVSTGGVRQVPEERKVAGEMKRFALYQANQGRPGPRAERDTDYQVSYRSGGGMAIAALAMAGAAGIAGEYGAADYLRAAEEAFDFLERNNDAMTNDGRDNIVDDACALAAATELYRGTHREPYKLAADRRAQKLMARLITDAGGRTYWRADDRDRPFFHASDAGLPVVSLLYYREVAPDDGVKRAVLDVVRRSLASELAVTGEVANPFGYARQYVQDKTGARSSRFFFPHDSEVAPWWQGENARLASLAAAARLAAHALTEDAAFARDLRAYATHQLDWILGCNPFDTSMVHGVGRNNPEHLFLGSWEFTNIPGGISNGITAGFRDERDIDFNLTHVQTGGDNDWRWSEQWLPHAAWYVLAVSARRDSAR
jgi:hypothetical protein